SRLGADELGGEAREELRRLGLDTRLVQEDAAHPTGTGDVVLEGGQPTYTVHENGARDHLGGEPRPEAALAHARGGRLGTVMQRRPVSRAAVQRLVRLASGQALVVCDINLRQHYYSKETLEASLSLSRWAKLNDAELAVLREMFQLRGKAER